MTDRLIVVSNREETDAKVRIIKTPASNCRNQSVLFRSNILVFVDKKPAIPLY